VTEKKKSQVGLFFVKNYEILVDFNLEEKVVLRRGVLLGLRTTGVC